MGFSLKDWLEEATATINPFDGGRTGATVRNERAKKLQPARTVSKPKNDFRFYENTPQKDTRSMASRLWDTANPFDSGRSWNTARPAGYVQPDDTAERERNKRIQQNAMAMKAAGKTNSAGGYFLNRAEGITPNYDSEKAMYDTRARSGIGQVTQPAVGAFMGTILKSPANIVKLGGGIIEEATPFNSFGQRLQRFGDEQTKGLDKFIGYSDASTAQREGENALSVNAGAGLGSLAASVVGAKLGGTALPSAMFGVNAAGDIYTDARQNGSSNLRALTTGLVAGGAEAALEKVGLDKFLGAGGDILKRTGTRMLSEGLQEAAQSGAQSVAQATYKDVDPVQAVKEAAIEGAYGAIIGGGAGLALDVGGNVASKTPEITTKLVDTTKETAKKLDSEAIYNREAGKLIAIENEIQDNIKLRESARTPQDIKRIDERGRDLVSMRRMQERRVKLAKKNRDSGLGLSMKKVSDSSPDTSSVSRGDQVNDPNETLQNQQSIVEPSSVQNTTTEEDILQPKLPSQISENQQRTSLRPEGQPPLGLRPLEQESQSQAETMQDTSYDDSIPENYVKEYADYLKSQDDQASGGQMIPDGEGGFRRTSEHSQFYRDFYKENKRKPSNKDWLEYAKSKITKDSEFMAYVEQDMQRPNEPSAPLSDSELSSLDKQNPQTFEDFLMKTGLAARDKPKGFIIKESKPVDGMKETVRVTTDKEGRLKKTYQFEPASNTVSSVLGKPEVTEKLSQYGKEQKPQRTDRTQATKDLKNKQDKKTFLEITDRYLGKERAGKISGDQIARAYNDKFGGLSAEQKVDAILVADGVKGSSDKQVQQAVTEIRNIYDDAYRYFTEGKGIKMRYRHNYSPRIYKVGNETYTAQEYKALVQGSKRQKGRTQDEVVLDKLVSKDPAELLSKYFVSLEKAAAGQEYMKDLEKEGLITWSADGDGVRGMRPILAEGLQPNEGGVFYAKKDVAARLNNIFGDKEAIGAFEKVVEKGADINNFMQTVVLSGGIPRTPINAFGVMQGVKESLALHPLRWGKAMTVGMNKRFADKFFTQKADILKKMAEDGVDPRVDLDIRYKNFIDTVKDAETKAGKVGETWHGLVDEPTFGRMMPALQAMHYEGVYNKLINKNTPEAQARKIAAESTKNFYGITGMAKSASRNKVGQDAVGALAFAPKFRESMVNFWVKNIKALNPAGGFKNARSMEYRDNVKFIVASGIMYASMNALNESLNGVAMWENPDDKEDKLLIPAAVLKRFGIDTGGKDVGIPFLSSIATVPRTLIKAAGNIASGDMEGLGKNIGSFASMPVKTVSEILSNQDYFGNPITDEDASTGQKITQAGSHLLRANMQPYLREGLNAFGRNLPEDVQKSLGIRDQSGIQTASQSLELPFRFYNPDYYKKDGEYIAKSGDDLKVERGGEYVSVKNLPLHEQFGEYMKNLEDSGDSDSVRKTVKRIDEKLQDMYAKNGLEPVKTTTRIAKMWADYERKKSNGSISKLEQASERKALFRDIYKEELSSSARDLIGMSDSSIEEAINEGLVSEKSLNEAIALDNYLTSKGLLSYSYLGKSLREKLGYDPVYAPGKAPKGRSGGRGGSSKSKYGNYAINRFDVSSGGSDLAAQIRDLLKLAKI